MEDGNVLICKSSCSEHGFTEYLHDKTQYKTQIGIHKRGETAVFFQVCFFNIKYITLYKHNIYPHIKADITIYT